MQPSTRSDRLPSEADTVALRWSLACVWLATGLLVVTPAYQTIGTSWLNRLGLPSWPMFATCAAEVGLGLWLLVRPAGSWLAAGQLGAVTVFTLLLAVAEPMLLVHPLGVLSKNLPFLLVVAVVWLTERASWDSRAVWLLRIAMAVVWLTEGILPKLIFQQSWELNLALKLGLPGDPAVFIASLGVLQALSGVAALVLPWRWSAASTRPRRWLRRLLFAQFAALLCLPTMVMALEPEWLVHPFGPLTKNAPLLVGTWILGRRC